MFQTNKQQKYRLNEILLMHLVKNYDHVFFMINKKEKWQKLEIAQKLLVHYYFEGLVQNY